MSRQSRKAKSVGMGRSYFDVTFQTEECEISNVGGCSNNSRDVIVNSYSVVEEWSVNFMRDDVGSIEISTIDAIINELNIYQYVCEHESFNYHRWCHTWKFESEGNPGVRW